MDAVSADPTSKTGIKNVVLVHGAFADGSGWEAVADILKKDGYTVSVVQHPETSYAEDVQFTKAVIDRQSGPVVLVGHSYGGAVITEAGNDPKVSALVYIAAFVPDAGESAATLEQSVPPASKGIKPTDDGYFFIDPAAFAADFAADVPVAKAEFMAESQVLISADSFTSAIKSPAWKSKPTWYMVATADRSINPDLERKVAKRANAKTIEVNSSHVAYISHPKETAKLIEEAAVSASSDDAAEGSADRLFFLPSLELMIVSSPIIRRASWKNKLSSSLQMERSPPTFRDRPRCPRRQWSFSRNCLVLTQTSERPATSWQPRDSSRSRRLYSGGKSPESTST
jgi:pimeloyl-ACP methyl ester carboxylesterase